MRPDRATNIESWSIDALTLILLRQFKRLLMDKGVGLTESHMQSIAEAVVANRLSPTDSAPIILALESIIIESLDVLGEWNLTFAQSLNTDMNHLAHLWQTTADFLMLANEKGNAEIRVSAGSALQTLLGDFTHVGELMTAIDHDIRVVGMLDVDAMICKRAICYRANIPQHDSDWLVKIRTWVDSKKS
ncbi:MAG TPA: hypothetical protein PLZ51_03490 [Aggregatilineales bacterium]|nr:hypothetical protein [Aggregatilineales bacterium]